MENYRYATTTLTANAKQIGAGHSSLQGSGNLSNS